MDEGAIFSALKKCAKAESAISMAAYMRNQFDFLGIQATERRAVIKPFLKEAKKAGYLDWQFVDSCWDNPFREMQYVALDYLKEMREYLRPEDMTHLKGLAQKKSWWDTIDVLDRIIGALALSYPEINPTLLAWSRDDDIWLRRIAIDHQLLRKEKTDTVMLEKILVNNLGHAEFFITKAIGWSLRDYAKTDPAWVSGFIARHGHRMAKLSLKEAQKYL